MIQNHKRKQSSKTILR